MNPLLHASLLTGFALGATLAAYVLAQQLHLRRAWLNPILVATILIILLLRLTHIPFADYKAGSALFAWLLGPATVALGVPMVKQGKKLKASLGRLLLVVTAGSAVGMATAGATAALLGASHRMVLSTLSKSVTTPIALQITEHLHGDPTITLAMVILSGLLGSIAGPALLRLARIGHDHAIGSAVGTASHGFGTAALLRRSEVQGSISSLAMAMAGVVTSILASLLTFFWH